MWNAGKWNWERIVQTRVSREIENEREKLKRGRAGRSRVPSPLAPRSRAEDLPLSTLPSANRERERIQRETEGTFSWVLRAAAAALLIMFPWLSFAVLRCLGRSIQNARERARARGGQQRHCYTATGFGRRSRALGGIRGAAAAVQRHRHYAAHYSVAPATALVTSPTCPSTPSFP